MSYEDDFHENDDQVEDTTLDRKEFEENGPVEFGTNDAAEEAGIEDGPDIYDPDEFEEGDESEEFEYLDGIDVPDPDNADEEEEANEDDFPDDEDGE